MRRGILVLIHLFAWVALLASPARAEADWPGFRGPNFSGALPDARLFQGDDLELSVGWSVEIGPGYSSLAVRDGLIAAMFAQGDADYVAAFDTETGEERWRYRIAETYTGHDGSHDGPIATPTIAGGRVFGLGAWGHLFAVDAATGKKIWATHLKDELGADKPWYGFSSSPLVAGDTLIVMLSQAPEEEEEDGDDAEAEEPEEPRKPMAIAGFATSDGELRWLLGDDWIEYQSPVLATLGGERQVVAAGKDRVYGIQSGSGEILWSYEHGGDGRAMGGLAIVPLLAGDDRLFLMNKVDSSVMLQVRRKGKRWKVEELWSGGAIKRSYVPPVYHEGYIYGMNNRVFTCMDAATGEIAWRSREPGDGFPILVGDHLVVMTKPGSLHVIEASPEAYNELTQLELFEEHSWSEPAFADGHLYARSMARLARVDLTRGGSADQARPAWLDGTVIGRFLDDLAKADDSQAAVERLLSAHPVSPILDDPGIAHFVYRGEATDVGIVGDMIGYRREDPMVRAPGTDLFYYSTRLEPDAAVTYGFIPDYGDPVPDPRNPQTASGLFGDVSWFAMPAWDGPRFIEPAASDRQGRLEPLEWDSPAFEGKPRRAQVYLPAGYDDGGARYPVAYVLTGKQALEQGRMKQALDRLIGGRVAPLIAVFIEGDEENEREAGGEAYAKMVLEELVDAVDARYRTIAEPTGRASVGFGRSGGPAFRLAFGNPDVFGRTGAQSPMLSADSLTDLAPEGADERPMLIYLDWGTYHLRSPHEAWSLTEDLRAFWASLREAGYRPAGGEAPEGFGWPIWSGRTDELLAALFPAR